MTGFEVIGASCAVVAALGVLGGGLIFCIRFGNRLAFAERDSKEALDTTKTHTTQLALTADHAETALKLGEKHTQALTDAGLIVAGVKAHVESVDSVCADIRTSLGQLDALRDGIGQLKTAVGVLTSQMDSTHSDVQELSKAVSARQRSSSKRRKR